MPISWELGKKVFENCATKLQCYLRGAVKAMNLEFDDFAEIVACICHDTFHGNNMVCPSDLLIRMIRSFSCDWSQNHCFFRTIIFWVTLYDT